MDTSCLLGLDIGTSSTKAILLSCAGKYIGHTSASYGIDTPFPGWAEQHPGRWIEAIVLATQKLLERYAIQSSQVLCIGLSGQMHGAVCVGHSGQVLRPAIIWADQRTEKQVAEVLSIVGKEQLSRWTGNPLATGFMLPSWLWLRENEPGAMGQLRWMMLPKDYIRFVLTGLPGTEPSDASSTSVFDPACQVWCAPLLHTLGLDDSVLPPVYPSSCIAGVLLPEMAERMSLRPGIPVIYGGSDQAMQAIGNGVIRPGVLSSTIGTGGQLFASTANFVVDGDLRMQSYCHVVPGTWHVETAILSAGLALKWLRDHMMPGKSFQALADAAQSIPPGAEGVLFAPYLLGERTPHMDPHARACLVGLNVYHHREHIVRAVMEGVVYALKQGLDLMLDLGVLVHEVVASGGAAVHPLWLQLQADIYNRPVYKTKTIEAAAFGAAMLAGVGVGCFQNVHEAIRACVSRHVEPILPQPEPVQFYADNFRQFVGLYPALHNINQQLR
jgi:xylulokinase